MEAEGVGSEGYNGVKEEKGVQILLLDGEEAFLTWTHTDSLYGARYDPGSRIKRGFEADRVIVRSRKNGSRLRT